MDQFTLAHFFNTSGLYLSMTVYHAVGNFSTILFLAMSQRDTYVSTIILHLDFWYNLKIYKNAWHHIWERKEALSISQPSAWFMITKLLPYPLFENSPQKKNERCRSQDLRLGKWVFMDQILGIHFTVSISSEQRILNFREYFDLNLTHSQLLL